MPDNSLAMHFDLVRAKTLRMLDAAPADGARWTPSGLHNTTVWHAGHIYTVCEMLTMGPLGKTPELPEGWHEIFSWESKPAEIDPKRYPPLAEIVGKLREQQPRVAALMQEVDEAALEKIVEARPEWNVRSAILHAFIDEAAHCGEIHLLNKLQKAGHAK